MMNDLTVMKFKGFDLTPDNYELAINSTYIDTPTQWEEEILEKCRTCVLASFKVIDTLKLEEIYSPETSSIKMLKVVDKVFTHPLVLSFFNSDFEMSSQAEELLLGISIVETEEVVYAILVKMLNELRELVKLVSH